MGLHKRLDVGPVWPARRARHRGQCRPSCLLVMRSLFAPDPMLAGALDRLRRRQPGRRSRNRSGRAERLRALWADGMWTPETPRVR